VGWSGLIIFFTIIIATIIIVACISGDSVKEYEEKQLKYIKDKDNYNKENKIPSTSKIIKYISGCPQIDKELQKINKSNLTEFNLWKDKGALKLVSVFQNNDDNCIKYSININDIISFNIIGDSYVETNISGGNSSIKGAVVGGVIAGGTGAVIGSRKEIKTENKYVDNRKTVIMYKNSDEVMSMFFSAETYETLLNLIPEKDVNNSNIINSNKFNNDYKSNVYTNIRELSKLKNEGIITEEEFTMKKNKLLDEI